jgi:hypothetical protein
MQGRNDVVSDELSPVKSIDFGAPPRETSVAKQAPSPAEPKSNKFYDFLYYQDSPG